MMYIFTKYILFNISYHIKRKFEFIKIAKIREIYKFLFLFSLLISIISMFVLGYGISKVFQQFISTVLYYYLLFACISIVLFPLFSRTKSLLNPMDKTLLYRTKLSNIQIFNLLYLTDVFKKLPTYISISSVGVGISVNSINPLVNILKILLSILLFIIASYIVQIIFISFKVKSHNILFSFSYLIINVFLGFLVILVGYYLTQIIVSVIIKPFLFFVINTINQNNKFSWENFGLDIKDTLNSINENTVHILRYFSPHYLFFEYNPFSIMIVILSLLILIYAIKFKKIGWWYRDILPSTQGAEVYSIIDKIYRSSLIKRYQWHILFSNLEECNLHKAFFYISYTMWFTLGTFYCLSIYNENKLANAFIIVIFLNNLLRDAFSAGGEFFTQSLRFDSEKRSIALYRITNTDFKSLYNAKLHVIRCLGYKEAILTIGMLIVFFNFDIKLIILSIIITLINIICIPHLTLLPSYISPHFTVQHYSEYENLEDQHLIESSIFDNLKKVIPISYFLIFFIGFIAKRDYQDIIVFLICWSLLIGIILSVLVYYSKKITTKKWKGRDLYY